MSKMNKIFAITITAMFIASIGAVTNIGNQNNNFVAATSANSNDDVGADLSEYTVPEVDYTVNTVGNLTDAVAGNSFKNSTGAFVGSASSGDTILLEAEAYNVDSTIDVQLSNITIAGEGSGSVISFSEASDSGMNVNASNVTIEGFELSGPENITAIHANSNADNLTVQSNTFTNTDYKDSDYPITTSGPNIALKIDGDGVHNVTFINNNVTGYADGVWAEGQNTDNLYVLNNNFNDIPIYKDGNSYYGVGVQIEHGDNLRVENNTFTGNIDQIDLSTYTSDNVAFNHYAVVTWTAAFMENTTWWDPWPATKGDAHIKNNGMTNLYLGTSAFAATSGEIINNTIDNNYIGIQIGQTSWKYVNAVTTGISIEYNDITNNYRGIWAQNFVPDGMHASYNNIVNNSEKGIMNEDPEGDVFNATYNWWGDLSGPSGVGPGEGDAVSENVTYSPWLDAPYPDGEQASLKNTENSTISAGDDQSVALGNTVIQFNSSNSGYLKVGTPSSLPGEGIDKKASVRSVSIMSNMTKNVSSIKINYTDDDDVESIIEESLQIYRWNGTTWNQMNRVEINTEENYVNATVPDTSTFTVAGAPEIIGGSALKSNSLNVWLPYIGIIGLISLIGGIAAYSGKEWFKNN